MLRKPSGALRANNHKGVAYMAHQDKSDSEKQLVKGTRRRSILRAGLAVPLGSSALLVACGGGGSSDPLMPAAAAEPTPPSAPASPPTPTTSAVASAPVAVQVPPGDPPPAKRVQEPVKKVRILNFQTPTLPAPANQRLATEDMKTYTKRALQSKFELLRDALAEGLPKKTSPAEICYFVAPEFFWNVNWDAVTSEDDIKVFSETCVLEVKKHVRALISLFPQEQFGKLALLPGTAQVLAKLDRRLTRGVVYNDMANDRQSLLLGPDGLPIVLPAPIERVYEAFNYVLMIDNFSAPNPDGGQPVSMWPKREVSVIDFPRAVSLRFNFPLDVDRYWIPRLGTIDIMVSKTSTTTATSNAGGQQFPTFDNNPLGGVPLGVDICLDYFSMYADGKYARMSQIEDTGYIIHFLIASGMPIATDHNYLPSVQYVVRNDGANHESDIGCEVFRLSAPVTKEKPAPRGMHKRIHRRWLRLPEVPRTPFSTRISTFIRTRTSAHPQSSTTYPLQWRASSIAPRTPPARHFCT
jgi:hypothetical protein